jgi:hypothetical protein
MILSSPQVFKWVLSKCIYGYFHSLPSRWLETTTPSIVCFKVYYFALEGTPSLGKVVLVPLVLYLFYTYLECLILGPGGE